MEFNKVFKVNLKAEGITTIASATPSPTPPTKPKDSAVKQQRLTAWQPILTAGTVLPFFFVIGILFIPVGIGLLFFSNSVSEMTIPYTDCLSEADSSVTCATVISNSTLTCTCNVPFNLTTNFNGQVFMYYALTNFYQNHRRYVKSRDDKQLFGTIWLSEGQPLEPKRDCDPFSKDGDKYYYPCGAIANSMFNDEITLFRNNEEVRLLNTGIAWDSDKDYKFKNPTNFSKDSKMWDKFKKPKAWKKELWELDPNNPKNNGVQNEDFIVWMRIAALPNFRKLYRRIDHNATEIRNGLPPGNYSLHIKYNYDVVSFRGTKSIVLSTTSLLGGRNPFLGVSYIAVGIICLVLAIGLLFTHIKYGKSRSEMINITANNEFRS